MGTQSYVRDTYDSRLRDYGVKADQVIPTGAIVMIDASNRACVGAAATGQKGAGFAMDVADATGVADNVRRVKVDSSEAAFANGTAGDAFSSTDQVGAVCYIIDGNTLGKTNGSSTRSAYGTFTGMTADGRVKAVPTLKV